jgi:hypothetical protein
VSTAFGPQCGERALRPLDLTLRSLFGKLLHATTSIDGRLLRTVARLLRRPGSLTLAYIGGERKPYIAPFQLFLLANVLSVANLLACGAYIFASTGPVFGARGPMRTLRAVALTVVAGAIVLGYRFVVFLITLYLT